MRLYIYVRIQYIVSKNLKLFERNDFGNNNQKLLPENPFDETNV